jgi:TorA maturation chaperone TorD
MSGQELRFTHTPAPEDAARAAMYGLLARLFSAGPDAALLEALSRIGTGAPVDGDLGRALNGLRAAAAAADPAIESIEHAELFVGTGLAPVSIYGSHYLSDAWKDLTLVELREYLRRIGLARQPGVTQPEDHLSALLEVMRHLAGRGDTDADIALQQEFFRRYLAPWFDAFCDQVEARREAGFYCVAARLLRVFLRIENAGFDLA